MQEQTTHDTNSAEEPKTPAPALAETAASESETAEEQAGDQGRSSDSASGTHLEPAASNAVHRLGGIEEVAERSKMALFKPFSLRLLRSP